MRSLWQATQRRRLMADLECFRRPGMTPDLQPSSCTGSVCSHRCTQRRAAHGTTTLIIAASWLTCSVHIVNIEKSHDSHAYIGMRERARNPNKLTVPDDMGPLHDCPLSRACESYNCSSSVTGASSAAAHEAAVGELMNQCSHP